jgi:hypothetical protein
MPPELLLRTFLLSIERFPVDRQPCVTAISISHVCGDWRALALSIKSMWTYVPVQLGEHWVRTALARSHPLPVDVDTEVHPVLAKGVADQTHLALLSITLAELARIRHLKLIIRCVRIYPDLQATITEGWIERLRNICSSTAAPALETFDCDVFWAMGAGIAHALFSRVTPQKLRLWKSQDLDISNSMFRGACPRNLREVVLKGGFIPHSSFFFCAPLTTLSLSNTVLGVSVADVINVLSHLPTLQRLRLRDTLWSIPHPHFAPLQDPILFPHLVDFCLDEPDAQDMNIMLGLLSVPFEADYDISFGYSPDDVLNTVHTSITNRLTHTIAGGGRYGALKMTCGHDSYSRSENVTFWPVDTFTPKSGIHHSAPIVPHTAHPASANRSHTRLAGKLNISCIEHLEDRDDPSSLMPIFSILKACFALPGFACNISSLDISDSCDLAPYGFSDCNGHPEAIDLWDTLAIFCPCVSQITVHDLSALSLLQAMGRAFSGQTALPFPSLRALVFRDSDVFAESVIAAVVLPKYQLESFRIVDCVIQRERILLLQGAVPSGVLYWDGYTTVKSRSTGGQRVAPGPGDCWLEDV